jgi:hypothetical protein
MSTTKALVWIVILFAVYSGYKLFPAHLVESRIERAVDVGIQQIDHRATDAMIRSQIVKRANAASVPLGEEHIQIQRETHHGERIVHVDVDFPISVAYLGSEITIHGDARATRSIKVDEAALARRAERERERVEAVRSMQERDAERSERLMEAMAECEEKWGKGGCQKIELPGGDPDEIVKMY